MSSITLKSINDVNQWQTPTLINNWVNFGSGWTNAQYHITALGMVELRGLIKSGTIGTTAFIYLLVIALL